MSKLNNKQKVKKILQLRMAALGNKNIQLLNIQETYRTPNRLEQKRNFSCHIIVKHQMQKTMKEISKK